MRFYHEWRHFFPSTLYPSGEKAWNRDGLAPQAEALSITPWPLGLSALHNLSSHYFSCSVARTTAGLLPCGDVR